MSERLETTESEETTESWASATEDHYSRMSIEVGTIGEVMYLSLPAITILAKNQEEIEDINTLSSVLFSKYTDQIIVGTPHEASLIMAINQASADLAMNADIIETLRDRIKELTGSYEAAGDWGRVDS
jgi:RNase H-fold protein (predicted Holliday junction resolvase)